MWNSQYEKERFQGSASCLSCGCNFGHYDFCSEYIFGPLLKETIEFKERLMDGQELKIKEKKDSNNNLQFFEDVITKRLELIKSVLGKKGVEYARGNDRFRNFKTSGRRLNVTPERALMGMRDKHETSIMDLIDDLDLGTLPTIELLEEKIGDSINYLILLEGMFKERIAHDRPKTL